MSKRAVLAIILILATFAAIVPAQAKLKWYKGNTHTHTLNSDGDSTPDDVVKWYREHGYNFLFLTDHEYITNVKPLNDLFGKEGSFLMIPGQEITDSFDKKPYHSNGLGISKIVMPNRLAGAVETLQKNIDDIRAAGGIAQVNHPNFGWALTADHLIKLQNYTLLEIHNGHPLVNNLGGGGSPGAEELWDAVLSSGKVVYGVADDDSHFFKRIGDPTAPTPGQGWIYARAADLSPSSILEALRSGNFYASTGVELLDYQADDKQITVSVKALTNSKYNVRFIGKNGRTLSEIPSATATYKIIGDEGYVRAKVLESNGRAAWTQPVFIGKK
ncbi:MAG TPA: CehA/McbA family metallohydrolase [Pyrinomonadaceae bacterium]|nr:PHP domain-containing protein [Acidobacteriota bacterium]HQZ96585.1 CehA/McbA family metallohydrolase [Pyrinomonadaceae bacterium]